MNRKDFTINVDDKELMLSFKNADATDFEEGDRIYATKVSSLIREGGKKRLLLRQELDKFLRESEIWTDADSKQLAEIQDNIGNLLKKLQKGGIKLSEARQIAIEISDKRKEALVILNKRQILENNTIESVAQNERIDYLIYACTVHADSGEKYWPSFEDMKNDKISQAYNKASEIAFETFYGIDREFEKMLPENKFLLKHKFIDNDLNYIDRKTGEKVDRNGIPVDIKKDEFVIFDLEKEPEQPFIDE